MKRSHFYLLIFSMFLPGCNPGCIKTIRWPWSLPTAIPAPVAPTPVPPAPPLVEKTPSAEVLEILPDLDHASDQLLTAIAAKLETIEDKVITQRADEKMRRPIFPDKSPNSFAQNNKILLDYKQTKWDTYLTHSLDTEELKPLGHKAQNAILRFWEIPTDKNKSDKNGIVEAITEYESAGGNDPQVMSLIYLFKSNDLEKPVEYLLTFPFRDDLNKQYGAINPRTSFVFDRHVLSTAVNSKNEKVDLIPLINNWIDSSINLLVANSKDFPPELSLQYAIDIFDSANESNRFRLLIPLLKHPEIPEVVKHYLAGHYYIDVGWSYRGTGYASTVTPTGWKKLAEYLDRSREHLYYAWDICPNAPQPPARLITISMAGHEPNATEYFWFNESIARCLDNDQAWGNLMYALGDNWGGSDADRYRIYDYVLGSLNMSTEASQKIIDEVTSDIHQQLAYSEFEAKPQLVKLAKKLSQTVKTAIDQATEVSERHHELHILFGIYYFTAGLYEQAQEVFNLEQDQLKKFEYRFWRTGTSINYALGKSKAMLSPQANEFMQVESFLINLPRFINPSHFTSQIQKVTELKNNITDPNVQYYCDDLYASLDYHLKYYEGYTVYPKLGQEMPGCYIVGRNVQYVEENKLKILRLDANFNKIFSGINMRYRYPAPHYALVLVRKADNGVFYSLPGVVSGNPNLESGSVESHMVIIQQKTRLAGYYSLSSLQNADKTVVWGPSEFYHMHNIGIGVWPLKIGLYYYGYCTQKIDIPDREFIGNIFFGQTWGRTQETFELVHPEIIRLDVTHKFTPAETKNLDDFYQERVERNWKVDPFYRYLIGCRLMLTENPRDSIPHFEVAVSQVPTFYYVHHLLAKFHFTAGDYPKAFECLQQALADPEHPEILNLAAWMLSTCPDEKYRNSLAALNYAKKACKIMEPAPWEYLNSLAAALAENDMFDEAKVELQKSLNMAPEQHHEQIKKFLQTVTDLEPIRIESVPEKPSDVPESVNQTVN